MSQGSGTACDTGCCTLCFCQAKPCPVQEGAGDRDEGGHRAISRVPFTCWGEQLQPVSQGPPLA